MKFKTFADVMKAHDAGELTGEYRLVEWTSTGSVTFEKVLQHDEEDYRTEKLYESESLETFLVEVAEAIGWEGQIL
jgi:hypothetical protein